MAQLCALPQQDTVTMTTNSEGDSQESKNTLTEKMEEGEKGEEVPRQIRMKLSKGKEYYGDVMGKEMHGRGVLSYADGTVYEGDFVHNKRHGRGRVQYASGEEYRGEWFNGFMTGKGTYKFKDGSVYEVMLFM